MWGVEGRRLKTFRCRVRAAGCTTTIDCLAPSADAAAYVIAAQTLQDQGPAWIQVVVSEWSSALAEYIEPHNTIIVKAGDLPPPGTSQVVFCGVTAGEVAEG
jgi:hypothetical protein